MTPGKPAFYGWRIVAACMVLATISWSLGIYGMGVYIHAVTQSRGFSIGLVSSGVTLTFLFSALLMVSVGRAIARHGSRRIVTIGAFAMATGVALMPWCQQLWQIYAAFLLLGLGMACLSTNTIGSTLAPWFEQFQGRAMSMAMLGASIGGMIGTPLLLTGIRLWGFETTAALAGGIAIFILWPLALLVLKRHPQDIGQLPDGMPITTPQQALPVVAWRLKNAIGTRHLRSHVLAFGLAFMVQVGFISHHVPIAIPILGVQGAATAVFLASVAAFIGRLLLTRYADQINIRKAGASALCFATVALVGMALSSNASALLLASTAYGLTIGNVTTLSPMIIRREFGAVSFGVVFGFAATLNQLAMGLGPTLYGVLRDTFDSYTPGLLLCGALNIVAALILVWGGKQALPTPA